MKLKINANLFTPDMVVPANRLCIVSFLPTHPFHPQSGLSRPVRVILCVWVLSVAAAIPVALQFGIHYHTWRDQIVPGSALCTTTDPELAGTVFQVGLPHTVFTWNRVPSRFTWYHIPGRFTRHLVYLEPCSK